MSEYISREAVLNHLNECKEDPLFDSDMARICFAISIFIEDMQAADVQPVKHGYWKEEEPRVLKCSVCGEYAPMNYLGQNCIDSSYCPWCGARMDGDAK